MTDVTTGRMTAVTGAMTGVTGVMTGKMTEPTVVVSGLGCSGDLS